MIWGRLLKHLRRDHGVSKRELQKITGPSWRTIFQIEEGTRSPQPITLERVFAGLGYELDVMLSKAPKFNRNPMPEPDEEPETVGPAIPSLEEKVVREDPQGRLDLPADYFA